MESIEDKDIDDLISDTDQTNQKIIQVEKEREYFCSELVAKAYKVLGILNHNNKSCTQYYPVCFTPGGQIDKDLASNLKLGPPMNILVNLEPKKS